MLSWPPGKCREWIDYRGVESSNRQGVKGEFRGLEV